MDDLSAKLSKIGEAMKGAPEQTPPAQEGEQK
jgi:hypothetical protein